MKKKINLFIHDYFQNFGGGERFVLNLAKKKDLILTSFINKKLNKIFKKKIITLQNNTDGSILTKKILTPFYFYFYNYKKVINNCFITGNYSVFFNMNCAKNKIFYCHALPKLFFDFKNFYNKKNILLRLFIFTIGIFFKKIYLNRIKKFDKIAVNSNYTKSKLQKYLKKKVLVVYPPIKNFKSKNTNYKNFFLSNSRHEIEKNIDKVINAFKSINNYNLLITSQGSQTIKLKNMSLNNKKIKFLGMVEENKYKKLLNQCMGTINVTSNEDLGASAIEGMTAGKPAFVINEGGYRETCKNNYNSFFINKNNIEKDLIQKINNFNIKKSIKMKNNCIKTGEKFSQKKFFNEINKLFI